MKRNFCGINERKYKILRTTLVKFFFFFRRGVMCTYERNLNVRQDRHSNYSIKTILLCRFENFTRSFEWVGFLFHFILFLISFLLDQKWKANDRMGKIFKEPMRKTNIRSKRSSQPINSILLPIPAVKFKYNDEFLGF